MPTIPTPPGAAARRGGRGPVRVDAGALGRALPARRGGHGAPALHALAGRRGGHRRARARFRTPIERAAKAAGVDPDRLEALVFLESAGRPGRARAGRRSRAPPGLTQILAETATVAARACGSTSSAARSYTRRLDRALREGNLPRAAALNRARRRVDDRFDPAKALAGTARYLKLAQASASAARTSRSSPTTWGSATWRASSTLRRRPALLRRALLRLHAAAPPQGLRAAGVASATTPRTTTGSSARRSRSCGWRARDPTRLGRIAALQTADDSARRCCCDGAPQGDLRDAAGQRRGHGAGGARGRASCGPRRAAIALYMAAEVRAISDAPALRRDAAPTTAAGRSASPATTPRSEQALAFQYVLDRLQVLNVIAWSRSERSIRVTASRDAKVLEPLLDRLGAK